MSTPDDIVGHKTFSDGNGGFRHEPLTRAEADAMWAAAEAAQEKRAADMPTVTDALYALHDAYTRLKELGWREARYGKRENVMVELIGPGSAGIHRGYWMWHDKQRLHGCFWIPAEGDLWPSHPILYHDLPTGDGN
jgi:hypothetical protein